MSEARFRARLGERLEVGDLFDEELFERQGWDFPEVRVVTDKPVEF